MSLPSTAANKPVVLPKLGKVCICSRNDIMINYIEKCRKCLRLVIIKD